MGQGRSGGTIVPTAEGYCRIKLDCIQACKDKKYTGCCLMTLATDVTVVVFMVMSSNCKQWSIHRQSDHRKQSSWWWFGWQFG